MSFFTRLAEDDTHTDRCHERWIKRLNRDMHSPDYKEEWSAQQCCKCRFYLRLAGKLSPDWGVCSNPDSACDRTVMFEHDGCGQFEEGEN
ncbi:MAG TPA: DUF3027 domain-containing protein [Planctomycetota bacterium]|jgi:hypothetical protein